MFISACVTSLVVQISYVPQKMYENVRQLVKFGTMAAMIMENIITKLVFCRLIKGAIFYVVSGFIWYNFLFGTCISFITTHKFSNQFYI